ncbi:hypothetical protein LJC47_07185, partial [Desulfosarcina sp. OttesenSCG-928-B08]|nr:hypothetical protein [Desulfosarcina sp. OttesenSCG-928-B08]
KPQKWKKIYSNGQNTWGIKEDGTIWSMLGSNFFCEMTGSREQKSYLYNDTDGWPKQYGLGGGWETAEIGTRWSFAVDVFGTYATGYNNNYELGAGQSGGIKTDFTKISDISFKQVASMYATYYYSGNHAFGVSKGGFLYGWGYDQYGKMGLGQQNPQYVYTPKLIPYIAGVDQAKVSLDGSMVLSHGDLYAVGRTRSAAFGTGDINVQFWDWTRILEDVKKIIVYGNASAVMKNDGSIWGCGDARTGILHGSGSGPANYMIEWQPLSDITDWSDLIGGIEGLMGIRKDGSIYGWGLGNNGVWKKYRSSGGAEYALLDTSKTPFEADEGEPPLPKKWKEFVCQSVATTVYIRGEE